MVNIFQKRFSNLLGYVTSASREFNYELRTKWDNLLLPMMSQDGPDGPRQRPTAQTRRVIASASSWMFTNRHFTFWCVCLRLTRVHKARSPRSPLGELEASCWDEDKVAEALCCVLHTQHPLSTLVSLFAEAKQIDLQYVRFEVFTAVTDE
jgi:hypothetical protein